MIICRIDHQDSDVLNATPGEDVCRSRVWDLFLLGTPLRERALNRVLEHLQKPALSQVGLIQHGAGRPWGFGPVSDSALASKQSSSTAASVSLAGKSAAVFTTSQGTNCQFIRAGQWQQWLLCVWTAQCWKHHCASCLEQKLGTPSSAWKSQGSA